MTLRFGIQVHTRPVRDEGVTAAELGPAQVATYIAKYVTKAAEDFGLTPLADRPGPDQPTRPAPPRGRHAAHRRVSRDRRR